MLNATATKIEFIKNTTKIKGVRYIQNDKQYFVNAKKEIILAAGAINTAKIMLHSGLGPGSILSRAQIRIRKEIQGIGRNLQFLLGVKVPFSIHYPRTLLNNRNIYDYTENQQGPLGSTGINQIFGILKSKYSNIPDIQIQFEEDIDIDKSNEFKVVISISNSVHFGNVTIPNKDPLSLCKISYKMIDAGTIRLLTEGIRMILKILDNNYLKSKYRIQHNPDSNCSRYPMESDQYWRCYILSYIAIVGPPIGTCKMGTENDDLAVVDNQLKVYGIDGLRVIDKGVMPSLVSGNMIAPTVMVAERGSYLIERQWGLN